MFLPGVPSTVIDEFQGAITRLDEYSVPLSNGFYSLNVGYVHGEVSTRYGHSVVFAQTDGAITVLTNWVLYGAAALSIVVYYAPSVGVRGYIQGVATFFDMMLVTGAAGSVLVTDGNRMYGAFYDSTGKAGFAGGQVFGKGVGADPLFAAPLATVPTVSETGSGLVTAGVHRIGYLVTTRNGFTTNLSPATGSPLAFVPVAFTSSGGKNLQVVIAGPIPATYVGTNNVQIVMTTAANLDRYFTVPGAVANLDIVTGATITLSITDDDLAATGTDVTTQIGLLTNQSPTAPYLPPFNPWAIFTYSSRMCYCSVSGVYISDKNDYQHITADQNLIVLDGLAQPIQGFSMRGVAYIGTQFGFFSTEDNGDVPTTWTPPQKVDGSVGILSPTCMAVNQAAGYAAIASERGLYIFQGGVFQDLPISYYQQSDWSRIDWSKPTQVQVVDDRLNKRIIVQAPLLSDSNGTPSSGAGTYQMTWDYTEGQTPETAKYSIDMFASYSSGAMGVIQNLTNSLTEVWYAPTTNGDIIRQNDGSETNPYRDVSTTGTAAAIQSLYQTSNIPGAEDPVKVVNFYHGAKFRVCGSGNMSLLVSGVDGTLTTTPAASPIALATAPGKEIMVKWFLMSEQASISFGTNAVDQYFIMARIEAGYTNAMPQR